MSQLLDNIIRRHKDELAFLISRPTVERSAEVPLRRVLSSPLVKCLIGPRRAGKSTLAFRVLQNAAIGYVNFEDEALRVYESGDEILDSVLRVYGRVDFLLFDEIQRFHNWEMWLNKLHRRGHNIIVTGSNSQLLEGELATSLTGRHHCIEVLPFSFSEFLALGQVGPRDITTSFVKFLKSGGFPEVVLRPGEGLDYLRTLFDSVLLRDIVRRHRVRKPEGLLSVINLLCNNIGGRFTARSLERGSGQVSVATVEKYLRYCTQAYLFFGLQQYSLRAKLRQKAERKLYTIDTGFIEAKRVSFFESLSISLENFVFIELLRRGKRPNLDLFYLVTANGYEVDFLVTEGGRVTDLIQVSYRLDDLKTRERELRSLTEAATKLGQPRLWIVTADHSETLTVGSHTVSILPGWRWAAGVTEQDGISRDGKKSPP